MSTFPGRMQEYTELSIDRFDGVNLESTVYLLSHKHQDHMRGLGWDSFRYRLESNSHIHMYVSDVTFRLLAADKRYAWLTKYMVTLALDHPTPIKVPDPQTGKTKYSVTLTLLHAGHCPGSVMFLFEGPEGTVLYTGDFRLSRSDVEQLPCLHSGMRPKIIDSMYLDTTFCVPKALHIPGRDQSTEALIDLIREWVSDDNPHHMAVICFRASLGYEHLFLNISQALDTKLHANERTHTQCQQIPELASVTTLDPSTTKIHICKWQPGQESALPCRYQPPGCAPVEVRFITVSTMWFLGQVSDRDQYVVKLKNRPNSFRVCYSFHSSYSEIRDIIMYLQPRRVMGNVLPKGPAGHEIKERLAKFQASASALGRVSLGESDSQPRQLGTMRQRKRKPLTRKRSFGISSESESLDFGDSPDLKKRRTNAGAAAVGGASSSGATLGDFRASQENSSGELQFHLSDVDSSQEVVTPTKLSQSAQQETGEESDLSGYKSGEECDDKDKSDSEWEANDEEILEVRQKWQESLSQSVEQDSSALLSELRVYVSDGEHEAEEFSDVEEEHEPNVKHLDQVQECLVEEPSPTTILEIKPIDPETMAKFADENSSEAITMSGSKPSSLTHNGMNKAGNEDVIILDEEGEDQHFSSTQDTDKTVDLSYCAGGATTPIDLTLEDSWDGYHGDTESDAESDVTIDKNQDKGSLVLMVSQKEVTGKFSAKEESAFVVLRRRQPSDEVIVLDDSETEEQSTVDARPEKKQSAVLTLKGNTLINNKDKTDKGNHNNCVGDSSITENLTCTQTEKTVVSVNSDLPTKVDRDCKGVSRSPGADSSECEVPPTPDTAKTRRLSLDLQRRESVQVKKAIDFNT